MRPVVVVVGGGISGLAAAHELVRLEPEIDVRLLEATGRLGGVLETIPRNGFLIESAADGFLTMPPAVNLCREVGLEGELIGLRPERRHVYVVREDRLEPIPEGFTLMAPSRLSPILKSRILSWRGKVRMGLEYVVRPNRRDEDESLASFVQRRFGREVFDRLVQPLVGGIYTADPEYLSVDATLPRFREMEREHGSLIRAMLRTRRREQAERSDQQSGRFSTVRRGMSSLVEAIAATLPPFAIRLNSPVSSIMPSEQQRWQILVGGQHPEHLEADAVVLATPSYRAARLLSEVDVTLANMLRRVEYASCAVVSLGYRRDQIEHPLDGIGFVVPLTEQRLILSCSFLSEKYEGRAPDDSVLLRVFIGGACQSGLLRLPKDQMADLAETQIADLLGINGKPVLRHVSIQHRAMPQYHVGHLALVGNLWKHLRRHPTLTLAGNAYEGVGVPSCIRSGELAAARTLSNLRLLSRNPMQLVHSFEETRR